MPAVPAVAAVRINGQAYSSSLLHVFVAIPQTTDRNRWYTRCMSDRLSVCYSAPCFLVSSGILSPCWLAVHPQDSLSGCGAGVMLPDTPHGHAQEERGHDIACHGHVCISQPRLRWGAQATSCCAIGTQSRQMFAVQIVYCAVCIAVRCVLQVHVQI